jgi:hypothetical protein
LQNSSWNLYFYLHCKMIWVPPQSTGRESTEGDDQQDRARQLSLRSTDVVRRFRERSLLVLTECRRVYERHNKFRHLVDAIVQGPDDYTAVIEELSRETGGQAMLSELEKLVTADADTGNINGSPILAGLAGKLGGRQASMEFAGRANQILELAHELTSTIQSVATIMRCIAYDSPGPRSAAVHGSANIRGKGTLMMFESGLHAHPMGEMPTVELPALMQEMGQLYAQFMSQIKA